MDFLIGIVLFILVAFFASTNTRSALPAPMAQTHALFQANLGISAYEQSVHNAQYVSMQNAPKFEKQAQITNRHKSEMIFMALAFSALLTLTIQFWRNFRRAYASPRRRWGKG